MEYTYDLMFMLMLLFIRSSEGTSLGSTVKEKTGDNFENKKEVKPSLKNGVFLGTKNISALIGEEVTLVVETFEESNIQDIQWVINGINFATTKPHEVVTIRNSAYEGRLRGSNNGSLVIRNLAEEDQGEYKADILLVNSKNYELIYFLHISEERRNSHRTHMLMGVVLGIFGLVVISAGVAFMIWKKKKMCFKNIGLVEEIQRKPRSEPEGKCEEENEELQQKVPSPSAQNPQKNYGEVSSHEEEDVFMDAAEYQEEET
ncbi:uncharacterized protein LOC142665309 [Rhinoderma darwinii]|uniref:uncharacterized protein LOC142665309 n=1 Tax=Rhinoderma darwinii TaxID=43563 RepID=UPI003F67A491